MSIASLMIVIYSVDRYQPFFPFYIRDYCFLNTVLTTSTEIILGTRKCGPCQERVFIHFKLQEAIEAVIQLDLWKRDHSRIITDYKKYYLHFAESENIPIVEHLFWN